MIAADILFGAQNYLAGLGVEAGDDFAALPELAREDRKTVEALVQVGNAAYPLPGDDVDYAVVTAAPGPWLLPDTCWRLRRLRITEYADPDKKPRTVRLIPESLGDIVPQQIPVAFLRRSAIYAVGGQAADTADRVWGWKDSSTIEMNFVTEPVAPAEVADTLASPDDAEKWLVRYMAKWMIGRIPGVDIEIKRIVEAAAGAARTELLGIAAAYWRG